MTERQMQIIFWKKNYKYFDFMIPNYKPRNWYECDIFCISRLGRFCEFEIKNTVADFHNDLKKIDSKLGCKKHSRIKYSDRHSPANFSYITPRGLVKLSDVPEYAGLLEMHFDDDHWKLDCIRSPKLIHERLISDDTITHAKDKSYIKMWGLMEESWNV